MRKLEKSEKREGDLWLIIGEGNGTEENGREKWRARNKWKRRRKKRDIEGKANDGLGLKEKRGGKGSKWL